MTTAPATLGNPGKRLLARGVGARPRIWAVLCSHTELQYDASKRTVHSTFMPSVALFSSFDAATLHARRCRVAGWQHATVKHLLVSDSYRPVNLAALRRVRSNGRHRKEDPNHLVVWAADIPNRPPVAPGTRLMEDEDETDEPPLLLSEADLLPPLPSLLL